MLNTDEVLEFLRNHRQKLKSDFHIIRIGLIGSFARGEQTEKSDIDLFNKKRKLKELLKTTFNRDVDICREKYIKPHFKNHLLKEVIYV
ncbi:hypothetical protein GWO43_16440 [candidate division KSB1 bacterium]|nr:hypothetical protein [candidate division KSB1 bacterium]NIR68722.1 hypothetical protein [candidate division KSB1 bacterium]NIS25539.1 hypothetical protein [candidate division KSB1 bacterium]NIT72432.1 hypothetical protein [candidate division KSB1 bacterium]NIU26216.1 hypothetical protein [candidate division KSB1 bacterium]